MFDGINLQTATYCILIFLVFIYKDLYVLFSYIVILTLIFFLSYNLSNKAYLGDNGTQILGFIWHPVYRTYKKICRGKPRNFYFIR